MNGHAEMIVASSTDSTVANRSFRRLLMGGFRLEKRTLPPVSATLRYKHRYPRASNGQPRSRTRTAQIKTMCIINRYTYACGHPDPKPPNEKPPNEDVRITAQSNPVVTPAIMLANSLPALRGTSTKSTRTKTAANVSSGSRNRNYRPPPRREYLERSSWTRPNEAMSRNHVNVAGIWLGYGMRWMISTSMTALRTNKTTVF